MIQTPKNRFMLDSAAVAQHMSTVTSTAFMHAMDMAMLELIRELPSPTKASHDDAAANAYRLEGARAFRAVLEHLGELPVASQPKVSMPSSLDTNI